MSQNIMSENDWRLLTADGVHADRLT